MNDEFRERTFQIIHNKQEVPIGHVHKNMGQYARGPHFFMCMIKLTYQYSILKFNYHISAGEGVPTNGLLRLNQPSHTTLLVAFGILSYSLDIGLNLCPRTTMPDLNSYMLDTPLFNVTGGLKRYVISRLRPRYSEGPKSALECLDCRSKPSKVRFRSIMSRPPPPFPNGDIPLFILILYSSILPEFAGTPDAWRE